MDVDLTSCYGSALEQYEFPIGKTMVYSKPINARGARLGTFLKVNRKSLVDNLFQIAVSGSLSFEQDLIFSKTITKQAILSNYRNYETSVNSPLKQIDTSLVLLRREIENGIINTSILEIIEKVCTNLEKKEIKEIFDLEVITAIYYPKELRKNSLEEWSKAVLDDKIDPLYPSEPTYWTSISLYDFIHPLVQKRKFYQQE